MDIRISKESELLIYEQVASQILFLIGTGELQPGDLLPSVRGLATRLKIHRNTVSHAYRRLVEDKFLARRRGSRLAVRSLNEGPEPQAAQGLDDLIDGAIASAQAGGYTLQQLHRRIKERMEEQPPDRILAVSRDVGLRILLQQELRRGVGVRVESCSPSDLRANRDLATGALVTVTPGAMSEVRPLLPKRHPVVQIGFSDAVEHLAKIRKLQSRHGRLRARATFRPAEPSGHGMACPYPRIRNTRHDSTRPSGPRFTCNGVARPVPHHRHFAKAPWKFN